MNHVLLLCRSQDVSCGPFQSAMVKKHYGAQKTSSIFRHGWSGYDHLVPLLLLFALPCPLRKLRLLTHLQEGTESLAPAATHPAG